MVFYQIYLVSYFYKVVESFSKYILRFYNVVSELLILVLFFFFFFFYFWKKIHVRIDDNNSGIAYMSLLDETISSRLVDLLMAFTEKNIEKWKGKTIIMEWGPQQTIKFPYNSGWRQIGIKALLKRFKKAFMWNKNQVKWIKCLKSWDTHGQW